MKTVALLSVLVVGCVPPPPPGVTAWDAGTLALGVALSDVDPQFTAMPAEVELHPGAQGGFHVPVMYQVVGQREDKALFEHTVRRTSDSALVSRGSRTLDVTSSPWVTAQPIPTFMCPTPVGINILGEELIFEVTVTSSAGVVLTRESAKTTLHCPMTNTSFCESICKG